ncbi:MAG: DUF3800 domain-containing protein [Archaeoglobaceae archaeon]
MIYVFIDESGDLGFTEKSSKFYVIATVEVKDLRIPRGVIKSVRKSLHKKKKDISEFKFSRSSDELRKKLLNKAVESDMLFSAIILEKRKVYDYLRDKKDKLHNYLTGFLANSLEYYAQEKAFKIVVDKFIMSREQRADFDHYFKTRLYNNCKILKRVDITHEDSQQNPGLQIADFVAGAIFRRYERGLTDFYDIIKPKLRYEDRKWF